MADSLDHAHKIVERTAMQRLRIVEAELDMALLSLDAARTTQIAQVRERNIQNALKVKGALKSRLVCIEREREAVRRGLTNLEKRLKVVHEADSMPAPKGETSGERWLETERELRHLGDVSGLISRGEALVAEQKCRVAQLREDGHSMQVAQQTLESLQGAVRALRETQGVIQRTLRDIEAGRLPSQQPVLAQSRPKFFLDRAAKRNP